MIYEGVNDIGEADDTVANLTVTYDRLIAAYKQISTRIHTFGIPLFVATITPFSAPDGNTTLQPYTSPLREQIRQKVNAFIRQNSNGTIFDGLLDFDAVVRNQSVPSQLAGALQSGDYLHPNDAGYALMAQSFDLHLFSQYQNGVSSFI